LHSAHPFGANTKLMILISLRNGSAIVVLLLPHLGLGSCPGYWTPLMLLSLNYGGVLIGPAIKAQPAPAVALPVFVLSSCASQVALAGAVSMSWASTAAPAGTVLFRMSARSRTGEPPWLSATT